jgi:hypothetical protein
VSFRPLTPLKVGEFDDQPASSFSDNKGFTKLLGATSQNPVMERTDLSNVRFDPVFRRVSRTWRDVSDGPQADIHRFIRTTLTVNQTAVPELSERGIVVLTWAISSPCSLLMARPRSAGYCACWQAISPQSSTFASAAPR